MADATTWHENKVYAIVRMQSGIYQQVREYGI